MKERRKWLNWFSVVFKDLNKLHRLFWVGFFPQEKGKNTSILHMPHKPYSSVTVAGSSLYTVCGVVELLQ